MTNKSNKKTARVIVRNNQTTPAATPATSAATPATPAATPATPAATPATPAATPATPAATPATPAATSATPAAPAKAKKNWWKIAFIIMAIVIACLLLLSKCGGDGNGGGVNNSDLNDNNSSVVVEHVCNGSCPVHCPEQEEEKPSATPVKKPSSSSNNGGSSSSKPPVVEERCKHTSTKEVAAEWTLKKVIGSEAECAQYERKVQTVCTKCNEVTATKSESKTEKEHTLENGKCTRCGYQLVFVCQHTNTTVKYSEWSAWQDVGTESSCRYRTRVKSVICDCGKVISEETEKESDHEHAFSGRTCSDCGYKKPLSEGSITVDMQDPEFNIVHQDDSDLPAAKPIE